MKTSEIERQDGDEALVEVGALIALFENELDGVRFPGADAATLGAARDAVVAAQREVERCAAALEAAGAALRTAREGLLANARRAQAYARVFADGQEALLARIDAIVLPRAESSTDEASVASASVAPRRRGRPSKSAASSPSPALFGDPRVVSSPEARPDGEISPSSVRPAAPATASTSPGAASGGPAVASPAA
jgi:hypothetical protein